MSRITSRVLIATVDLLSLFSLTLLYRISDMLYYLLYYVIRYRRKVVESNLKKSFPEKSENDLKNIEKQFYRNLCDIIVENIKLHRLSEAEIVQCCVFKNMEILYDYFEQGKSVIAAIGHCGNWELAGLGTSIQMRHRCFSFYKPLKNQSLDLWQRKLRAKFGMELIPITHARKMLKEACTQPNLYIFITDQTPSNAKNSHWMQFLNQDTPVFKGAEKVARMLNAPVVFADIQRTKRGHYTITVELLHENPASTAEGELTTLHTRALEKSIRAQPDNWLWSHRRWKKVKPAEIKIAVEQDI